MLSTSKMKSTCPDRSNQVQSVAKTKKDNDMIDHTRAILAEKETELSSPIE